MKMSFTKRMLALLLVLCMIIPMLPALKLPVRAAAQDPVVDTADSVIVVAGSDFQHSNAGTTVSGILSTIKGAGYNAIDGFLFAGDYSNGWDASYANPGVAALKSAVNSVYPGLADSDDAIYVQGNHDPTECITSGVLSASGAHDADGYGVFVINEDDFRWRNESTEANTLPTANGLRSYLNNKIARGYTKPIFVVSHVPLHFTMRTVQNGDSMYANLLYEVLYEAADAGLNIIFMYGHNHSASWEDSHGGTSVFYTKGDTINIAQASRSELKAEPLNFTYMNAGYVGYYTPLNSGVDTTLNMSLFEITDDAVTITRYTTTGTHDLKSAGVPNTGYTTHTESDYFQPDTTVTGSPVTIELNKDIDTTATADSGVAVESDGVTGVEVSSLLSDRPVGFSYYRSYDIKPIGYTQGNTATVSIPLETGLDQSRPLFVIDHANNATIPAQISGGNVVFTTDHFSWYTVAQMNETTVTAYKADTVGKSLVTVLTGEGMQQNIPYIITEAEAAGNYQWMLTGTAATKSGAGTGLLLEDYGNANTSHVWYFDGTYLRYGSPTGKYLLLNAGNVTLSDTLDEAAAAKPVQLSNSRRHNFQRADGTAVYLNRHGGTATDNVALTYTSSSYSRWYVHKVVSGVQASAYISASQTVMPMDGSIQLVPSAILDYSQATPAQNLQEHISNVSVTWISTDSSIATVDENGVVTPVAPGQVYIRAKLDSVNGIATTSGRSFADILITVTEVETTDNGITASTRYGQHVGERVFSEAGNKYVIQFFSGPNWYLTGNTLLTTSEHYNGLNGTQGLQITPYSPLYSGTWYYDGTNLIHGDASDTDQYLVWDGSMITTGTKDGSNVPFMVDKENGYPLYPYLVASSDRTEGSKRMNQLGGYPYNVVGLYNGSNHVSFYEILLPTQEVSLTVSPSENLVLMGTTLNLTEKVMAGGVSKTDYTIQWASSDTSIVNVDDQGVITTVGVGETIVVAALTHLDGVELSAPLYVGVPVRVEEIPDTASHKGYTEPFLTLVNNPEAGVPYYVTSNSAGNYDWVLTNIIKTAQGDASYSGPQLIPYDEGGSEHVWYLETETDADGNKKQYLRYGNLTDENNYLIVDPTNNKTATLGAKSDAAYDLWQLASDGAYTPLCTTLGRYLNQHGGPNYDTAVATSSYGSHAASRWRFNTYMDSKKYTFSVTPANGEINLSETLQLVKILSFDGISKNSGNFAVKYTSSDPTVAAVTSSGEVIPKKGGMVTIKATLVSVYHNGTTYDLADDDISVYTTVTVYGISSVSVTNPEGYLPLNASHALKINAMSEDLPSPMLTVTYSDGSTYQTALIGDYLRTADGEEINTNEAGTLNDLQIVYKGVASADRFKLNIIKSELPDDPEYPNEGAVFINKTATGMNFQSSGVAQVELSVSGIPVKKGADVIIMLDTSSSMNGGVAGSSEIRINVLCRALNNLLNDFQGTLEDGSDMDIRVAIADFNGNYNDESSPYYLSPDDHLTPGQYRYSRGYGGVFTGDKSVSASAFMDVRDLGEDPFTTAYNYTGNTTGKYKLTYHSGTNYDYAFDVVYELGEAVNDANAMTGQDRDLFVIFMSDGCPFQFNYFSSISTDANWNNWVTGTLDELDYDPFAENANRSYYNEDGKHWMAEAIKGDTKKEYPVIRKNDYRDNDNDTWIDVRGLGAKMYSIGFCLADDRDIPVATMETVLKKIATPSEGSASYCYLAETADQLDTAFSAISGDIMYAASDAYFVDTMGAEYDLQLGHPTYQLNGINTTFSDNKIEVRNYDIYTVADMDRGECVESQLGVRKTDANGNQIYTVSETVTFNASGTQAYSDKIFVTAADGTVTYSNILIDGVICANSFWYNTTTGDKTITLSDGTTRTLPAETFYWKVGRIQTVEVALNYFVYLTRARGENGGRIAGIYPTNKKATLYYTNYLGNACEQVAPIPKMPWGQAQVSYGFYLVNKAGKPIVNIGTGQTGSFEKSVRIGDVTSREFMTNTSASLSANKLLPRALAETYRLFDSEARYDVSLNSDGYGTIAVYTNGNVPVTTYIEGVTTTAFKDGDVLGTQKPYTGFATANTTVWFAVTVADDALVVDKTVDTVEGKDDEFMLTLEAFASGGTTLVSTVKPADIVLVLDQSASMYTPAGLEADRYYAYKNHSDNPQLPDAARVDDFVAKVNAGDETLLSNAKHLGYYIALHNTLDYMYIVQYVEYEAGKWGWFYVPVNVTSTPVQVDTANATQDTAAALFTNLSSNALDSAGKPIYFVKDSSTGNYIPNPNLRDKFGTYTQADHSLLTNVTYYQTQYGALYDSVNQFVSNLNEEAKANDVNHRVAIVGFSSPYYDAWDNYNGTGMYINGNYYLYDTDYLYKGSMNGSTLVQNANGSIILDPDRGHAGNDFVPYAADPSEYAFEGIGDRYATAFADISTADGLQSVQNSINAITTNYMQTCPAIGLRIARSIFRGQEIPLADPGCANSSTTAEQLIAAADPTASFSEDREQIIVLFTDGTPTVSMYSDHDDAMSKNAEIRNEYWTGNGGARDAINEANAAKREGIEVYTIGTAAATQTYGNKGEAATAETKVEFLDLVSSNYLNSTSVYDVVTPAGDNTRVESYNLYVDYGTRNADSYALSAKEGMDLDAVFDDVMTSITVPLIQLDSKAVLRDVLSEYFQLVGNNQAKVEVYTAPFNADGTTGELVPLEGAVVTFDKTDKTSNRYDIINVTGYDYEAEYYSEYARTRNGKDYYGSKLVVKIPVEARTGFWGGNNVPTNKSDTAIYTADDEPITRFPMPQANVPVEPQVVGQDKTVYYGGSADTTELIQSIIIGGLPVDISETGNLTPRQDWMDDFANLTWTEGTTIPGESLVSGKDAAEYPLGVTLTPIYNGANNTETTNPSNIAGQPVAPSTAEDTANVYVLEPVITWKDMTINLGDAVGEGFFDSNDFVSVEWVDQDTRTAPTLAPTDAAPTLDYNYSYSGKPLEDTPVDVHVISSYGSEDITHVTTYHWQDCDNSIHMINRDQIFEHNGTDASYEFYIHVVGDDVLVSNKYVELQQGSTDQFVVNLEGYVTGSIDQITVTKPADIVLVLDHSGSMHTPVGATEVLYSPNTETGRAGVRYTGAGQMTKADLDTSKGSHRGYYVAQSTSSLWWFLMEYDTSTNKWIGYSIPSTESIVDPNPNAWTEHTKTQTWSYNELPSQLVFYKTQYGVLYDSVLNFVEDLRASGVEHCVSIVGFAGAKTAGTRLYVGGDEDTVKRYTSLYLDSTSEARRTELFRKAMKNVQDQEQYGELLSNIEAIETNSSFTCPSAGIHLANELYNANDLDRTGRDRIMILFTDGIPNRGKNDGDTTTMTQTQIYDEIVKEAAIAKQTYGTILYSVSTTTLGTNADRTFLSYSSSDYPNATGYATPGNSIQYPRYTMQVNGIDDMDIVFDTVTHDVSGTEVKLDGTAVLKDTLSDYVQLQGTAADITVYTQAYLGNNQWGTPVLLPTANVSITASKAGGRLDTVEVTGFNYSEHYISEEGRTQTITNASGNTVTVTDYRGSKILVEVKVEARDGFWGGNNVPTNKNDSAIYGSTDDLLSKFPEPQVNVPIKPTVTAKEQVVYYGEDKLDAMDDLVGTINVDGKEVTYDEETGKFIPVEDWMNDFADMTWNPDLLNPADPDTVISGTKSDEYPFGVVLVPTTDGTNNNNTENPGNIAGDPVSPTDGVASDDAVGEVDVLVPVISFEDSTIWLGDPTDSNYYESVNRDPTVQWVNQDDPYGKDQENHSTTPSAGFETVPDISFSYSTEGTGDNYFTKDTPINVEVHLGKTPTGDNKITDDAYFDWTGCDSDCHDDNEIIADDVTNDEIHRHKGSVSSSEFYVHVTCLLDADAVVIDFGIPVDVNATFNDILPDGAVLTGIKTGKPAASFSDSMDASFVGNATSNHGTLTLQTNGKLRYESSDMKMNASETFQYQVKVTRTVTDASGKANTQVRYYYSTVTVIPATIIYYEDDFLKYYTETKQSDDTYALTEGGWTQAGKSDSALQQEDRPGAGLSDIDADNIYGSDHAYTNMNEYSYGSAMMFKATEGVSGVAKFSFRGTGFDVVSLSSDTTGVVLVMITDADTGKTVVNYMVDTYYGYQFNTQTGKWEVNPDAADTLYQVPVIKVDMNNVVKVKDDTATPNVDETEYYGYGHYDVEIIASYSPWFAHGQCECDAAENCTGCYDFYLDAIRIYNPANDGAEDVTVQDAYIADHEYKPTYEELRNHLITKENFDSLGQNDEVSGVIFIDGNASLDNSNASGVPGTSVDTEGKSAVADYANYGPNNELYLASGQAVSFKLNDVAEIDQLHLALKSVGGAAEVTVYGVEGTNKTFILNGKIINTATDLYYNITDLIGKTVVILNSGDSGMLSITNLKTTYLASGNGGGISLLSITPDSVALALASLNEGAPAPVEPTEGTIGLSHATLSFEDEIIMNAYFKLDGIDVDLADLGMIIFSDNATDGTVENADTVISGGLYHSSNGLYSVSTNPIAAKNLGDTIYFRIYARLSDGTYVYSNAVGYSPKSYANKILSGNYSTEMKALVVSMLNYGAAAQTYFGYRTDDLVNAHLTAEQQALAGAYSADLVAKVTTPKADQLGAFAATANGFTAKYPTVSFEGAFAINYYFTPDRSVDTAPVLYYWTKETRESADVLTAENASGVLTTTGYGTWQAAVTGIAAKDLDETIWVAAVYESQGERYCSGVLAYSLGAYCVSQAAKDGTAMQPFAAAAAVYGSCAKAYFS